MQTSTGECSFDGCKNIGVCVGYYKHRHHCAFFPDIEPYYQCDIHFGLNHDLSHDPEFFHHLGICSIHDCIERGNFYGTVYLPGWIVAHIYKCPKHIGVDWDKEN